MTRPDTVLPLTGGRTPDGPLALLHAYERATSQLPGKMREHGSVALADMFPGEYVAGARLLHPLWFDPTADPTATWDGDPMAPLTEDLRAGVRPMDLLDDRMDHLRRFTWREFVGADLVDAWTDWEAFGNVVADSESWPRTVIGPAEGTLETRALRALLDVLATVETQDGVVASWWDFYIDLDRREGQWLGDHGSLAQVFATSQHYHHSPTRLADLHERFALWTDVDLCTTFLAVDDPVLLDRLEATDTIEVVRLAVDQPVLPQSARPRDARG